MVDGEDDRTLTPPDEGNKADWYPEDESTVPAGDCVRIRIQEAISLTQYLALAPIGGVPDRIEEADSGTIVVGNKGETIEALIARVREMGYTVVEG